MLVRRTSDQVQRDKRSRPTRCGSAGRERGAAGAGVGRDELAALVEVRLQEADLLLRVAGDSGAHVLRFLSCPTRGVMHTTSCRVFPYRALRPYMAYMDKHGHRSRNCDGSLNTPCVLTDPSQ